MTGSTDTIKEGFTKVNDIIDDLAAVTTGLGASCIGVFDTAGNMAATDVEAALAEVYTDHASTRTLAEIFDEDTSTTTGLTWGWKAGKIRVDNTITSVAADTISVTDDSVNYIEISQAGIVSRNGTGFTAGYIPIRQITAASGVQTVSTDKRAWFVQIAGEAKETLTTAGDTLYASAANTLARLAIGAANTKKFVSAAGTAPEWAVGEKIIFFTRDMAAATGDVAYTGAGFKPSAIEIFCCIDETVAASFGVAVGTGECCIATNRAGTAGVFEPNPNVIVQVYVSAGNSQNAIVTSMDADGCTFTWTRTGAPGGTLSGFIKFAR